MVNEKDAEKMAKVTIKVDSTVENGVYANSFTIANTENEFMIDFSITLPGIKTLKVVARIIIHPRLAKKMLFVMQDSVKNYEKKFGEITFPASSAVLPTSGVMN